MTSPTWYLAQWALRKRLELIDAMGGKCQRCGSDHRLEFHHPNGRDYDVTRLSRWQRMIRYRGDLASGNLQLLCRACNRRDGGVLGAQKKAGR